MFTTQKGGDSMANITRIHAEREPLLTPVEVAIRLAISRDNAYALMRMHGFKLGRRYYITAERLDRVINDLPRQDAKNECAAHPAR